MSQESNFEHPVDLRNSQESIVNIKLLQETAKIPSVVSSCFKKQSRFHHQHQVDSRNSKESIVGHQVASRMSQE
jgi:hypothetical protein